ncbi:MAG TPA: hypothetical protein VGV15_13095 [Terriglobales bacterium]|nr:hypothetical protein [Terriglobales bacterium]
MAEELSIFRKPAPVPAPTLRDIAAVLFRQRRLWLISFCIAVLAVVTYGIAAPSYQAEMKVMVRRGRMDPVMTPAPTQTSQFPGEQFSEAELNSEVELLRDEQIMRTVAQSSGLGESQHWFERLRGDDPETRLARAVRKLGRRLTVEPIRKTDLIEITYSASDPESAAKVLNCLASAYLERNLEVRRPSGEVNFFEQQVVESRQKLENAEFQLMDFTNNEGVVSAALERDIILQKLSDADATARQTRIAIAETVQRIRMLESDLHSLPERATTVVRDADNPQLLEKMKSKVLELELKRTELLTKYEPTYRLVQEVDQQIAETKASLAAEERAPLRDQTTEPDPNHEWAKAELMKAQVELTALEARVLETARLVTNYQQSARRLGDNAIEQARLLQNLKGAEERYVLYTNKREEARIGDALDQGGVLNVTIAERPRAPALPVRSAWNFGLWGIVLGSTLSTGLAFTADRLDPAFRTPDEVVAYLGTRVLASLPERNA